YTRWNRPGPYRIFHPPRNPEGTIGARIIERNRMHVSLAFAATALLSLAVQDKSPNPEFDYWSGHKTGSWVKLKMELEAQGVKVLVQTTHTLLEVGKDKAVVEQKNKFTTNGQEQPETTEKEEILRDKDKDPIKIEKEGDEEIEVAGKKLKCHWIEGTQKDSKVKFWLSKEIRGGVAKGEMSGGELPGVMKVYAVGWEKK